MVSVRDISSNFKEDVSLGFSYPPSKEASNEADLGNGPWTIFCSIVNETLPFSATSEPITSSAFSPFKSMLKTLSLSDGLKEIITVEVFPLTTLISIFISLLVDFVSLKFNSEGKISVSKS